MNTDQAREFLVQWMKDNFLTDKTFEQYIRNDLAGDFAYQLVMALQVELGTRGLKPLIE